MGEEYFGIIKNARPEPLPAHMKLSWQPIEEYDRTSSVLFRSGSVQAFGKWEDGFGTYVEIFETEITPLTFEPCEFSYVSYELAFALVVM